MARSTKTFTLSSPTYGKLTVTVPSARYATISKMPWALKSYSSKDDRPVAYIEDAGSTVFLHRALFGGKAERLIAKDGNWLNCSEKNIVPMA